MKLPDTLLHLGPDVVLSVPLDLVNERILEFR